MPKMTKTQKQELEDRIEGLGAALTKALAEKEALQAAIKKATPVYWAAQTGEENLVEAYNWHLEALKLL